MFAALGSVVAAQLMLLVLFGSTVRELDSLAQVVEETVTIRDFDDPAVSVYPLNSTSALRESSILFGVLSEIAVSQGVASRCAGDVQTVLDGIRRRNVWALKILDTGPHMPTAFVFGNNFWFTASALCTYLNAPVQITHSASIPKRMRPDLLNSTSPVRLKPRMVYANFTSPMQIDVKFHVNPIIHIGLCLPESCADTVVFDSTKSYLGQLPYPVPDQFDINMTVIATKSMDFDLELVSSKAFYLLCGTIAFAIITFVLAQLRSGCDALNPETPAKSKKSGLVTTEEEDPSVYCRTVRCFDLAANCSEIFTQDGHKGIASIAGIRSIACIWVLIFHVSYHSAFTVENTPQLIIKMEYFTFQPVFQAYLYVDSFFVLSGILLVYNFLRSNTKLKQIAENCIWENSKYFMQHVVHRYIRLTPVLIVTMIVSELLYTYLENYSPFWVDSSHDLDCRDTWWMNIFYVQNFLKLNQICSSWTWYLACDMQYYVVGLFVLFVYAKCAKSAQTAYFALTTAALLISFYLSWSYNLTYEIDVVEANSDLLYTTPWTRINPFLGGALIGWFLYGLNGIQTNVRPFAVALYWIIATALFLFSIFMTYKRDILPVWCALMLSLGKFVFGLFIGSIVVMCHHGYGGFLSTLLSHNIMQHLSKLTFSMYMVSPIVVTSLYGLKEVSTHFDEISTVANVIAAIVGSYVSAVVFAVLFELPFQKLSDEFVMKKRKTTAK